MKISISSEEWIQLESRQRDEIQAILSRSFASHAPVAIVPTDDGPRLDAITLGSKAEAICQFACDVAEASAIVACQLLGDRVAIAACVAAAKAAGKICKVGCKRLAPPTETGGRMI